jgi:hypothetical protein
MMDYGRVLFIPLIIECRLSSVKRVKLFQIVKSVGRLPIVFMIAQRFPATH